MRRWQMVVEGAVWLVGSFVVGTLILWLLGRV